MHLHRNSLQSSRNFGERVPSNFITKIMAAIFNFNSSERLGREICTKGAPDGQK